MLDRIIPTTSDARVITSTLTGIPHKHADGSTRISALGYSIYTGYREVTTFKYLYLFYLMVGIEGAKLGVLLFSSIPPV